MVLRQPSPAGVIADELAKRLRISAPWAGLYIEADDRAANAILERIVREVIEDEDLFEARSAGDFVILTVPHRAEKLAETIVESFDREMRRASSVAIAIVTSERPSIKSVDQIDAIADELTTLAKSKLGSNYVKDRHR